MRCKFVKYSICDCGFPILSESIPIGTLYEIDTRRQAPFTLRCGGCRKEIKCTAVWVESRAGGPAGFLPMGIFEPVATSREP